MIVDGKKIAEDIFTRIKVRTEQLPFAPVLAVITCAPNFETQKYLALKERKAKQVGIETKIIELKQESTTEDFIKVISDAATYAHGIIVQLPLPPHVDTALVLTHIPISHDVDALNPENTQLLSPVVGACKAILGTHEVLIPQKFVTVIGSGRLVGLPAYHWFVNQGAHVSVVTKDTIELGNYTKHADIIVCGAGAPGLLTPEMIQEGVVILDAGTSEDGGELRGDVDPRCAEKAMLFTPVPGGIGPITIAILLQNVVDCALRK
jgi:methylenetetrahydrofolate dehydrogenase (NADP+) / methenyltetrahydrofolate cyclohydrolase